MMTRDPWTQLWQRVESILGRRLELESSLILLITMVEDAFKTHGAISEGDDQAVRELPGAEVSAPSSTTNDRGELCQRRMHDQGHEDSSD